MLVVLDEIDQYVLGVDFEIEESYKMLWLVSSDSQSTKNMDDDDDSEDDGKDVENDDDMMLLQKCVRYIIPWFHSSDTGQSSNVDDGQLNKFLISLPPLYLPMLPTTNWKFSDAWSLLET